MKPLLAYTITDTAALPYPVLVSPKLDGIRCLSIQGVAMSRSLKRIPNEAVQKAFSVMALHGLDGELIVGDPKAPDCFAKSTSGIMSRDGSPKWAFHVFDYFESSEGFLRRLQIAQTLASFPQVKYVSHKVVKNEAELLAYEAQMLLAGFEGIMVRRMDGHYKHGRSTAREGVLGKLKRFEDAEAFVIGYKPLMRNKNEQTRDELGRAKRSSAKAGKVADEMLGVLEVRGLCNGKMVEFEIGSGFTEAERVSFWIDRKALIGKAVTYKFQNHGIVERPRLPIYKGFRDAIDL